MYNINKDELKKLLSKKDYEYWFIKYPLFKHLNKEICKLKEKNISNEEIINNVKNCLD